MMLFVAIFIYILCWCVYPCNGICTQVLVTYSSKDIKRIELDFEILNIPGWYCNTAWDILSTVAPF